MKKLIICIPTYNRAKIVQDVCEKIVNIKYSNVFDVYIYDSSPNFDTKDRLQEILDLENFFYFKVSESIHSNEKVYHIFQDKHIQDAYEYLWVLPDYLFVTQDTFQNIAEKLNEDWDMLMLDFYDLQKRGSRPYWDPNEILFEYAWSLTQYGSMILSCERVLKKADWRYLTDTYLNDKCRNFSHVAFYFEMMLKIPEFRFYHLSICGQGVYRSVYKADTSDYFDDYLKVWGYCWYNCINALPEYYINKQAAIKKASVCTGYLGKNDVTELRIRGILTWRVFCEYKKIWPAVSTVPVKNMWVLVLLPKFAVKYLRKYDKTGERIRKRIVKVRFRLFCSRYNRIYLYGAGVKGERLADFMNGNSIKFDGFIVSQLKDHKQFIKDHKVFELVQVNNSSDMGIVIALNERNKMEVIPLLHENGYRNLFLGDPV